MARILTNKYGFPEPIVRAMDFSGYTKRGDISVTTLIDSPKVNILKTTQQYYEDISDMIWSLRGQALHVVLERSSLEIDKFDIDNALQARYIAEKQMEIEFEGVKITGTADQICMVNPETLYDYKDTSVWKVIKCKKDIDTVTNQIIYVPVGDACLDWKKQTNIYAWMLRKKYNIIVKKIRILVFLKDWKKQDMYRNSDYPERAIIMVDIPIYNDEVVEAYIKNRLNLHKAHNKLYREGGIDNVPECEPEQRWKKDDTWKIMKDLKATKSSKNFSISGTDKEKEVQKIMAQHYLEDFKTRNKDAYIKITPGFEGRCMDYCPVNSLCNYYKKIVTEQVDYSEISESPIENS